MTYEQIWKFHSILRKKMFFFCKLTPSISHSGGVGNHNFSVQIMTFHAIPSKKNFKNRIHPPS